LADSAQDDVLCKHSNHPPFFKYLEDWFYRELSQETHLTLPGLVKRGSLLDAAEKNTPNSDEHLEQYRAVQATMAFVLMLAICSELEHYFRFGLRDRLLVMWHMLEECKRLVNAVARMR
jgi:hypothetical protein